MANKRDWFERHEKVEVPAKDYEAILRGFLKRRGVGDDDSAGEAPPEADEG